MSAVPPMPSTAAPGNVPNHLAWAIVSTVLATCLCCPLGLIGIVAIVFSSQVNGKLNQGDLEGAQRASANAKTWCWVATAFASCSACKGDRCCNPRPNRSCDSTSSCGRSGVEVKLTTGSSAGPSTFT